MIRQTLEPLPERLKDLSISKDGYPVPWFVAWIDGEPEFRTSDHRKWILAIQSSLCWVCGKKLGTYKVFVIGPMCGINRITAEPPCHLECAQWSARNCPFLSNPNMVRREDGLIGYNPGGVMIKHNPGATLLWTTKNFKIVHDGHGGRLIEIGPPLRTEWYAKGKIATREQVIAAVERAYPTLAKMAESDGEKINLQNAKTKLESLYPNH